MTRVSSLRANRYFKSCLDVEIECRHGMMPSYMVEKKLRHCDMSFVFVLCLSNLARTFQCFRVGSPFTTGKLLRSQFQSRHFALSAVDFRDSDSLLPILAKPTSPLSPLKLMKLVLDRLGLSSSSSSSILGGVLAGGEFDGYSFGLSTAGIYSGRSCRVW